MSGNSTELIRYDKIFVGGEWIAPATDNIINVLEAHSGKLFAQVPEAGVTDIDAAVSAARRAFDEGPWPRMSADERAALLIKLADNLQARADEFARIGSTQNGGTLVLNQTANIPWGVNAPRAFAQLACDIALSEQRDCVNANAELRRMPVGVAAAIVPFNISFIGTMAKLSHALAAGCTLVLKPAPETPLEAYMVAEAAIEAGIPAGVLNVVAADRDASERLVTHPDVNVVSFTGSTLVGINIATLCAAQLKRCSLELGGNAASIILDDMPIEPIVPGLLGTSMLLNSGQACIAQSRILVSKDRYEECIAALKAAIEQIVIGDPRDPDVQLGPVVSERHMQRVLDQIDAAVAEGARLVTGGKRATELPAGCEGGWFVEPTLLADVTAGMESCKGEIFGPVIKVIAYDTEQQAVAIANNQPYGLSSSVWSADEARAVALGKQIVAGNLYINGALAIDPNVPFVGLKESGMGVECGREGLHEFLEYQAIYTPKPQQ